MPASLNSLTSEVVTLPIKIGDDPAAITVKYRPHNLTAASEGPIQEKAAKGLELEATTRMFLEVVSDWDFKWNYEDEAPIPLTYEAVSKVPVSILVKILEQIKDDRNPDPKTTG